jgi:hypothetical protein
MSAMGGTFQKNWYWPSVPVMMLTERSLLL